MAKLKRGQSKYMPHVRSALNAKQAIGRQTREVKIPNFHEFNEPAHRYAPAGTVRLTDQSPPRTPEELKTKGQYGGLCNRSACLSREAYWYNRGSYAHYCQGCANLINQDFRHRDDVELYGTLLVKPPVDVDVVELPCDSTHPKPFGVVHGNGTIEYFDTEEEACGRQKMYRYIVGLRSDGSDPLWFSDMAKRYEHLRTLVTIKGDR